ncbi:hypothetical protein ABZP36_007303 [Zizania latifolia]
MTNLVSLESFYFSLWDLLLINHLPSCRPVVDTDVGQESAPLLVRAASGGTEATPSTIEATSSTIEVAPSKSYTSGTKHHRSYAKWSSRRHPHLLSPKVLQGYQVRQECHGEGPHIIVEP